MNDLRDAGAEERNMFSIGDFSKVCMVSVKTLRHYDKIGLMRPKFTDPFTGYRYYSEEQLSRMLLIQRLKRYGFSLADIGPLLEETDESALFFKLKRQKLALTERLAEISSAMDELT